jgi:hypothetical protein
MRQIKDQGTHADKYARWPGVGQALALTPGKHSADAVGILV